MRVTGQCHCGAIAFEAEVAPGAVGICHCADCQKLTGSAFRTTVAAREFRLLRGEPRAYVKVADSGARRVHSFCPTCGTPIHACAEINPDRWSLRIGTLDQRHEVGRPARQIWTSRRLAWVCDLAEIPAIDLQP